MLDAISRAKDVFGFFDRAVSGPLDAPITIQQAHPDNRSLLGEEVPRSARGFAVGRRPRRVGARSRSKHRVGVIDRHGVSLVVVDDFDRVATGQVA